jgi:hypothetical protein
MTAKELVRQEYVTGTTRKLPAAITVSREMITADASRRILDRYNNMNRTARVLRVRQYRDDMLDDQWLSTGVPIIFDTDDELVDGAHRLRAQADANLDIEYIVVRGVEPAVRPGIDAGAPRTFADDLRMNGEDRVYPRAALMRRIMDWERWYGLAKRTGWSRIRLVRSYPAYRDSITSSMDYCMRFRTRRWPGSYGSLEFFCWLAQHENAPVGHLNRFLHMMLVGSADTADTAIVECRYQMIRLHESQFKKGHTQLKPADIGQEVYLLINAWNSWHHNSDQLVGLPVEGVTNPYPQFYIQEI